MFDLGTGLTRREFWKVVGVTGLASAINNHSGLGVISRARQKILDDIVRNEPSPYVGRVIYDHTGSLTREVSHENLKKDVNDPQYLEFLVRQLSNDPDVKENIRKYFKNDSELRAWLLDSQLKDKNPITVYGAQTISNESGFGRGAKSDIYFYPSNFEQHFFRCISGRIIIDTVGEIEVPTKEKIRTSLRHEYSHAKAFYKGINLGNGLVIDNSNHLKIDPRVKWYVSEIESYLSGVEFARQFGSDHPVYWYAVRTALLTADKYYERYILPHIGKEKDKEKFTPYELRLVQFQLHKIIELLPESRHIEMRIQEKLKC